MVIVAALTGSNTLRRISFVPCSCDDQNYVIPVINNSIHRESDRVCGQYLLTGNLKHFCSDVNNLCLFKKREDEDQTRASNCCLQLYLNRHAAFVLFSKIIITVQNKTEKKHKSIIEYKQII